MTQEEFEQKLFDRSALCFIITIAFCLIAFISGRVYQMTKYYPTEQSCLEKLPRNLKCEQRWKADTLVTNMEEK
jgi:hypothetical protein